MKKHLFLFLIWLAAGQLGQAANPWGDDAECSSSFSDVQFVTGKAQVAGVPLEPGDWVCAFDPNGTQAVDAVGVTNSQGSFALVIYECSATPAEGINNGEQLTLQFYDASADLFYTMPNIGQWLTSNNGGAFPGSGSTTIYSADGTSDPQLNPPPLPVDWLFFQVKEAGEKAEVAWATAQETDSDFFLVEHSRDGRHFEPIGKVTAAGNSADESHYFFTDARPNIGVNYYRLKQVDADGRFEYSAVRSVEIRGGGKVHIFPNPASHVLHISFGNNFPEGGAWSLFDFSGNMVKHGKWEDGFPKKINMDDVISGSYFLRISDGHQNVVEKVFKE